MTDEYSFWRDAVAAGRGVETEKGSIRLGYYRRRNEAIAFWRTEEPPHIILCWRSDKSRRTPTLPDEMEDLFAYCAASPVSYEDWQFFQANGRWPEQLEPPAAPDPELPPDKALDSEITALRAKAEAWIKEIGSVNSQAEADKAANYSEAFAALEKRAVDMHKAEKAPFLEGGRAVDAKWKPLSERAAGLKAWAKKTIEPFLLAERKRIADEERQRREEADRKQREADAARAHAASIGAPPPPAPEPAPIAPPPQKAGAGTAGRKVSLRTRSVVAVTDWRAFLTYLAGQNDIPDELRMAVEKQAKRMIDAGFNPPGVEVKEVEVAA